MQAPTLNASRQQRTIASALIFAVALGVAFPLTARLTRLLPRTASTRTAPEPGMDYMMSIEYEWITQSQTPGGAIAQNIRGDYVIPYFANLSALALLRRDPDAVRTYMGWYIDHLNRPDSSGLFGTIYNYAGQVPPDAANGHNVAAQAVPTFGPAAHLNFAPTMEYDSADSYAATFLSLVEDYTDHTGDESFARGHIADIKLVADVILALQDEDGLVWAKADHPKKYLMDNSEDYRGLEDFAALLTRLGQPELGNGYRDAAARIASGIEQKLWDPKTGNYYWYLAANGRRARANWKTWYPDAVSQLYPILNGLIQPGDSRAKNLWATLNRYHGEWVTRTDLTPWAVTAYVATVMGDNDRADAAFQTIKEESLMSKRDPRWHTAESAFIYLAYEARRGTLPKHYLVD
ncbi:MAG: glucosidase family protein [Bacillota bacterium]